MGGFLFTPGGGAAAGSVLGPAGTIIGGALGTLGGVLRGGVPGGGTWEDYFRRHLGLTAPGQVAPVNAPPEFDFTGQTTDTSIYDEPIPELGQLPIPPMPWWYGDYQFPEFTPTFSMDAYGQPIEEQSSSTSIDQIPVPILSPGQIPGLAPWMYPTFPGYPDPSVQTPDEGTPTFPMTVIGLPWPTSGGQQAPVGDPGQQPQQPPVITEPPPQIDTPIPPNPFPPPTFPGPPAEVPPGAQDPSKPKVPGLGDLGALLEGVKGGPSLNLGGLNAPVVGGGVTTSLFPLPGINRFDIPSLGAYLMGRM